MKHQQVSVDYMNMVYTACTYLILAGAAWIFLRLLQACFWLPRHLQKQTDVQQLLQDKIDDYEKYILECEEKERAAAELVETDEDDEKSDGQSEKVKCVPIDEEKWKERRECLEMLKTELKRVREGGKLPDWDDLIEELDNDSNEINKEKEEEEEKEKEEKEEKNNDEKQINEVKEEVKMNECTVENIDKNDLNVKMSNTSPEKEFEIKKYK